MSAPPSQPSPSHSRLRRRGRRMKPRNLYFILCPLPWPPLQTPHNRPQPCRWRRCGTPCKPASQRSRNAGRSNWTSTWGRTRGRSKGRNAPGGYWGPGSALTPVWGTRGPTWIWKTPSCFIGWAIPRRPPTTRVPPLGATRWWCGGPAGVRGSRPAPRGRTTSTSVRTTPACWRRGSTSTTGYVRACNCFVDALSGLVWFGLVVFVSRV